LLCILDERFYDYGRDVLVICNTHTLPFSFHPRNIVSSIHIDEKGKAMRGGGGDYLLPAGCMIIIVKVNN
jgi:hypothetical protein